MGRSETEKKKKCIKIVLRKENELVLIFVR